MMNFFDPDIILPNGRTYKQFRYDQILNRQASIAYAFKGGVTLGDTELMSEYDLDVLQDTITEIREAEAEAQRQASSPNTRFAPRPRKSRFAI